MLEAPRRAPRDAEVIHRQTTRNNTNHSDSAGVREGGGLLEPSNIPTTATVLVAEPVAEPRLAPPPLTHYCCCDEMPGSVAPAFCGTVEPVEGGTVDAVSCVVCADLFQNAYCPNYGVCHGGAIGDDE